MAYKDIVKVSRKTFFNPSGWFGYAMFMDQLKTSWQIVKGLFVVATPERKETFEEAMQRFQVTDENVNETAKNYLFYSLAFLALGSASFIYAFYLLILRGTLTGWLLAMAVVALFLSQAFRFNFWYFQIKHRKLGCTFEEWWRGKPFTDGEQKPDGESKP